MIPLEAEKSANICGGLIFFALRQAQDELTPIPHRYTIFGNPRMGSHPSSLIQVIPLSAG
jgi:hypothetical protein